LQQCTAEIARRGMANPFEAGAAATDYLKLFALTALAFVWARAAEAALRHPEDAFYRAKLTTARFFMEKLLPQTSALTSAIMAGGGVLQAFEDAAF
jgi:butyryl-CoA dehydrogenase